MNFQAFYARCQKACSRMEHLHIDCMLLTPSSNMKYMTGYSLRADERLLTAVFAPGHKPFLFANALYESSLVNCPYRDIVYWSDGQDPFPLFREEMKQRGIPVDRIAVDDHAEAAFALRFTWLFPSSEFSFASEILDPLRMYKDAEEIAAMRLACSKADTALRNTILSRGRGWIGCTENEFNTILCGEMTKLGLRDPAAGVCAVLNSAEPHHSHDETLIQDNACLLVDFGANYNNYNTDMTRMFYFGQPDPEFLKVYDIVNAARIAGIQAAVAGNPLEAVDDAARSVIESAGYGRYFTHRTGHGIGIDCHEGPSAAAGEKTPIASGMTFSVEPGIYLPGKFGIRIEDQVYIEENGVGVPLHNYSRELHVLCD